MQRLLDCKHNAGSQRRHLPLCCAGTHIHLVDARGLRGIAKGPVHPALTGGVLGFACVPGLAAVQGKFHRSNGAAAIVCIALKDDLIAHGKVSVTDGKAIVSED